jgi:hypothetical protein
VRAAAVYGWDAAGRYGCRDLERLHDEGAGVGATAFMRLIFDRKIGIEQSCTE